jgi:hypothetical protein
MLAMCGGCRRAPKEVVLWVWERSEDLSRLPRGMNVAVLLASIEMRGDTVIVRPRVQPLKTPPGTKAVAVIRVDADQEFAATAAQHDAFVNAAAALPDRFPVTGVQIDFDATRSQREFYTSVLNTIRPKLPPDVSLSITALASWCLDDAWIRSLPITEAVPMLFRMGPDADHVVSHLRNGGDFSLEICRKSAGVSLDEPMWRLPARRKLYVFSPKGWPPQALALAENLRSTQ